MSLSFPVLPMKASMGSMPAGDDWAFEIKWDGYRTVAFVVADRIRLQSTSGKDVTERWPEFGDLHLSVNADHAILDAELVVFDDDGRPSFELVQRSGVGSDREAVLHLFDVLSINGTDVTGLPYLDRRRLLDSLVEPSDNWLVPAHQLGDGDALLTATAAAQMEGVIAKRLTSTYRPGTRAKEWVKIKNRTRLDVLIGGYTDGAGARSSTFGALLVGLPTDQGVVFAGGVGTGFDQPLLESLSARLAELEVPDCPFTEMPPAKHRRGAHWVTPTITATIEIAELTNDGLVRHASFVELAG